LDRVQLVTLDSGWGVAGAALYRTADAGRSWLAQQTPGPIGAFCFVDRNHGWVVNAPSAAPGVFVTGDNGSAWQAATISPGAERGVGRHTLRCTTPNVLWDLFDIGAYTAGEGYRLSRSGDGGQTWTAIVQNSFSVPSEPVRPSRVQQGPGPYPGVLDAVDATTAYLTGYCSACGGSGFTALGRTLDGGTTWRNLVFSDLPGIGAVVSFPTRTHGWVLTERSVGPGEVDSAIIATADSGNTWRQQYPPPR